MDRLADKALAGGERVDATDHCLASIARLSAEVKDASVYIPAYDQRTYSEVSPNSHRNRFLKRYPARHHHSRWTTHL